MNRIAVLLGTLADGRGRGEGRGGDPQEVVAAGLACLAVLAILYGIWVILKQRRGVDHRPHVAEAPANDALRTLENRYALGEIDETEYLSRRHVLASGAASSAIPSAETGADPVGAVSVNDASVDERTVGDVVADPNPPA